MSSEKASAYLHGFSANHSNNGANNPPSYNDIIRMNDVASAPLLEDHTFSSIFGVATSVQFEWDSSDAGTSGCQFLIRDTNGSLQAKGVSTSHNIVVRFVNGMEMLKIIERSVDEVDRSFVHTFNVIHKHAVIGTVKVAEKSSPDKSLQIFGQNGSPIIVNSLRIGDYAIFRKNSLVTPLCNLQMPNVEIYNPIDFNVKIIFYPQTGITEEEQLLCTAAAMAFKVTMKQSTEKTEKDDKCVGYCGAFMCCGAFIFILAIIFILMDKWGCEYKKSHGLPNRKC